MKYVLYAVLCPALLVGWQDTRQSWNEVAWIRWIAQNRFQEDLQPVRTPDGMYADIVTSSHAYEVEWAEKWKEAPGQALYYSIALNKKPGIILLWRSQQDMVSYLRLQAVCAKYDILLISVKTWQSDPFRN